MTVIDCFGEGRARGRAHGEAAREMVRAALSRWQDATLSSTGSANMDEYVSAFLGSTGLKAAVEARLPDLAEEVRGIAEGAGLDPALVLAYNFMDEQWWYDLGAAPAEPGCSLLARVSAETTLLAQNMDLPSFMDGSQLVLRLRDEDGNESLVLTSAGLIGLTGISSSGIAICVNTLLMLNHDADGIPVAFAMRAALAGRSRAEAASTLESLRHASGQHYAIADATGVTSLECSAGGCVAVTAPGADTLMHTNHPLASRDVDPAALAIVEERERIANSVIRLQTLDASMPRVNTEEDVVALLSDRSLPICVIPSEDVPMQTFASMVFTLGPHPSARFCLGQPGLAAWRGIEFSS